ncbi:MAG: hypothetical protein ACXVDZ_19620 [Bacteroidia bacterium]
MKKLTILFILSLTIEMLAAQVAGYMGKRCNVTYSVWTNPNLYAVTNTSNTNDEVAFYATQALSVDYLIKKRTAFCLGFQFSRIGLSYDNSYNANYTYRGSNRFPAYMNTKGISLGFKFFSKNKIAPLGTYVKVDALLLLNDLIYNPGDAVSNVEYTTPTGTYGRKAVPINETAQKLRSYGGGAALSLGRQRIFFDKLVVDGGVRFALAIAPQGANVTNYGEAFVSSFERIFLNQFVNLRVGVGFLAF